MRLKICIVILCLVSVSHLTFAQTDSTVLSNSAGSLTNYFNNYPVEKIYLHLDKTAYFPGDTIWFKAYTVLGQQHRLSQLSGVLYCELINTKDSVISRRILKLLVGLGWGDFDLPRPLQPGTYHIRAYTAWMRNAPGYYFDEQITIGGQRSITASSKPVATSPGSLPVKVKPDVQFFPEGGQVVNGLRSKIAVKCVNSNGLGEDIKGVVIDNNGNEVAGFVTQHLGMGVFALTPQAGKTYRAKITAADSSEYTIDLPAPLDEGFTLAVNSSQADSVFLSVSANEKLFTEQKNAPFYLVAQSGGKVFYTAAAKLAAPVFTATIAKSRFPTGIVQFTLFSQGGQPLNERIIFIQNDDALKITLSSPAETYGTRQKVKMDLGIGGNDKEHAIGSFSVSVTNESRLPVNENAENTILSNLLLTSDIKGYVEQPNYYFNDPIGQTRADLDILMLTQGYRRFEWKQVLKNENLPPTYLPETSLELAGSIKTPSGKAVPNGGVIFTAPRENFIKDTVTDADGNFKFANLNLVDTVKTIVHARKHSNGSNVAIYLQQPNYPAVLKNNVNTDTVAELSPEMLKNIADYQDRLKQDSLKNGRRLKEVIVTAKKEPKPDRFNQYGTAMEYDADMRKLNREFTTLGSALPSIIPGARYDDSGPITYEFKRARLIIDGLPHQTSDINLYDPREIESVRMIAATGISPAQLVVTTKRYAGTDTATTVLKEVKIIAQKVHKEPDLSESQNLHKGAADLGIMGDKLGGCVNLSDCLQGRAIFIHFGADGSPSSRNGRMSVIIDGNVFDGSHINDVNVNDVYSIEVLSSISAMSIYGSSIEKGGALVITMKHGGEHNYLTSENPAGLISYVFKGYYAARTFYSPKYDKPNSGNYQTSDLRSTIYWNPNIITGKDGKASFEYYNADTKGTYRVVIEGIDDNGNIGRQVYRYKVE